MIIFKLDVVSITGFKFFLFCLVTVFTNRDDSRLTDLSPT